MAEHFLGVDPRSADSPEQFVALLRQVRERSDVTYRQIERRCREAGHHLPTSTLATMLARPSLPREEMVVALVSACGGPSTAVAAWTEARRHLAWATSAVAGPAVVEQTAAEPSPVEPSLVEPSAVGRSAAERRAETELSAIREPTVVVDTRHLAGAAQSTEAVHPPRRLRARVAVVLAGVLVAAVLYLLGGGLGVPHGDERLAAVDPSVSATASDQLLPPGPYRFRLVHSGLCLSERPDRGDGHLYQAPCAEAMPAMSIEARGNGVTRITTLHAEFGPGCTGVENAELAEGAWLADDLCDQPDDKDFRLEPVTAPAMGYRLRNIHSGLCAGTVGGSTQAWAAVVQLRCDDNAAGQVFALDAR